MTYEPLISAAAALLRPHTTRTGRLFGDVASIVVSGSGTAYPGVCVDTPGWGLCAERSAMAAMITQGEYRVAQVVAVWRDPATQALHVLPPCGICREFMRQADAGNLDAEVVLGLDKATPLRALLPAHEWPAPVALGQGDDAKA